MAARRDEENLIWAMPGSGLCFQAALIA